MKVFVHKSERSRVTGSGTFFSFLLASSPGLHQSTFSAYLGFQQVDPLARFSDDLRWTRWEMLGTPGKEGKLVGLLTILISIYLALQGQPGLQSPRGLCWISACFCFLKLSASTLTLPRPWRFQEWPWCLWSSPLEITEAERPCAVFLLTQVGGEGVRWELL